MNSLQRHTKTIKKLKTGYNSTMGQGFEKSSKCRTNNPTNPFLCLTQHIQEAITSMSPGMVTFFPPNARL